MNRRTKWLARIGRQRSAPNRSPATRSGRPLRFEHCEPRVVLSTNAMGGAHVFTTTALTGEGGLIGYDFVAIHDRGADYSTPLFPNSIELSFNHNDAVVAVKGFGGVANGVGRFLELDSMSSPEPFIRRIAPPLAGVHYPEGGQIAINELPRGGKLDPASSQEKTVEIKVARQPLAAPALEKGGGSREASPLEGLRGRAIVFEVANAATEVSSAADALVSSARGVVMHQATADVFSGQAPSNSPPVPAVAAQPAADMASSSERPGTATLSASYASSPVDAVFQLASPPASPGQFAGAAASAVQSAHRRDTTSLSPNQRIETLASRDAAFQQLARDDDAPADTKTAPTPAEVRTRRVLALAIVLTLGSGPVSKIFRRRTPDNAVQQQPPRRRPQPAELV